jgi:transposase-like protein
MTDWSQIHNFSAIEQTISVETIISLGDIRYMRKSRFSARQIADVLEEAASGVKISEVCVKHGISVPTFYLWKSKYQHLTAPVSAGNGPLTGYTEVSIPHEGLGTSKGDLDDLAALRKKVLKLERENDLLRRLFIDLSLERASLRLNSKESNVHSVA